MSLSPSPARGPENTQCIYAKYESQTDDDQGYAQKKQTICIRHFAPPNRKQLARLQHGTKLIGQCRDRYDLDYEVGMRKRSNPDDLRGRRIVVAAELWAMLSKELVHHVLTELGELNTPPAGNGPFTKNVSLIRWSSEVPNSSKSDLMFVSMLRHCAGASPTAPPPFLKGS
jgi:hypothetical protein